MAFTPKFVDLVRNFTTVQGTGPVTLGTAVTGYTGIAEAMSPGDQFYYCIQGVDKPQEREVGRGTLQADGRVAREPVSGAPTDFTSGTKTVALVAAAEWFERVDGAGAGLATAASRGELAMRDVAGGPVMLTEAGCEGLFVFKPGNLVEMVTADPREGIYVAPEVGADGSNGAWVRSHTGPVNVRWFGAKGDGIANDAPAIQAALNFLKASKVSGHGYGSGGSSKLFFPAGVYNCGSTTIEWDFALIIEGEFASGAAGGGSVLRWTSAVSGLRPLPGSAGSVVRHLLLKGTYTPGNESEAHGIELRFKALIEDVYIEGFAGDGVHGNSGLYNLNDTELNRLFIQNCRTGIYFRGLDANALVIKHPQTVLCRQWGIHFKDTIGQSTILGGTHHANGWANGTPPVSCHHAGNIYRVIPGQEAWCSTNAPSGTKAHNQGWAYCYGLSIGLSDSPNWASGMTWRAGGVAHLQGESNYSAWFGGYWEGDQPPAIFEEHVTAVNIYATTPDGSPYPVLAGGSASMQVRALRVGHDHATNKDQCRLHVDGDAVVGSSTASARNANLIINATNTDAALNYALSGTTKVVINADMNSRRLFCYSDEAYKYEWWSSGAKFMEADASGINLSEGKVLKVGGAQVVGAQAAAVADATDAPTAITQLNALLERMRSHGLIAA